MPAFRDWPSTLRRASFRGAQFFVESDQLETGRRLVVHEFPLRDAPYIEDLGRKAGRIQVTAYLVGDSADSEAQSLRSACERRGAGTLSLPLERFRAHCEECRRDFNKDRLGYVAFSLSFARESSLGAGGFPASFLAERVLRAGLDLRQAVSALFLARFATLGLPGFVRDGAADVVRDVATTLDVVARGLRLEESAAPHVFRKIQALYADAAELVDVGSRGDRYAERSYVQEAEAKLSAAVVTSIADIVAGIREAADPDDIVTAYVPLIEYQAGTAESAITDSRRRELANAEALSLALRAEALGQYAGAIVSRRYTDRRQAIQARADVAERFDAELARLAGWESHALYVALDDLRGMTADHLSSSIATLAPIVAVGSETSMPSLWWAHRLYGDANRAGELAQRNRIKHPSFMPTEFEALAR